MAVAFYVSLAIWLVSAFYKAVTTKSYLGVNAMVAFGIYLPMAFYMLGWSTLIDSSIDDIFYLLFISLNICLLIYNYVIKVDSLPVPSSFQVKSANIRAISAVNAGYLMLFFLESYMGSGSIVPALQGIDIHTYSAPIISFITRSLYIFVFVDVLAFLTSKQKIYAIYAVILCFIPFFTRTMRISTVIVLFQIVLLCIWWFLSHKEKNREASITRKMWTKRVVIIGVAAVLVISSVLYAASITNDRMNHYGQYDLKYSEEIKYTGPDTPSDILAVYYGYFPMSFNNLNLSIKDGTVSTHKFMGLFSFKCLYFGILQFDNIFNIPVEEPDLLGRVSAAPAANVATAFFDYYYDFKYLAFIPIAVMIAVAGFITRCNQNRMTVFSLSQYFYFVPLIFFESFQNLFFGPEVMWEVLWAWIICSIAFPGSRNRMGLKRFREGHKGKRIRQGHTD